jgi:uncharacterized protein with HEPN domain
MEITKMRIGLIHGHLDTDVDFVWNTASIDPLALLTDLRRISRRRRKPIPRRGQATSMSLP